ncbi:NAD(P)H-quinone oxidoreductase [Planctomyces sp. SH-PL62]|uniref:NAD(P)H-quinone oxidoreductase n=1 Tax=Planctomyces sp. SH-PL62 TaxID=1636152 RepID=UPI00078ECF2D|nr:NAD(P)H-quinone oxidoreductase [Planctomyces sp. SH-PL62]AMV36136.1 Phthiocerol synthesis polyketide synthase type I PpsC [Planctomyces sp. SH-PL62]
MRAVVIKGKGGPEVLEVVDRPRPEPRGEQVLVRVRACALNRADLLQARGLYPAPPGSPADIPGLEFAGEIEALGPDAEGQAKVGDRVFGIVAGGAQAEYLTTHPRMLARIPDNLDFDAAGAVPEAFLTAHDALTTQGGLTPGGRVLIHAAGSGVGTAAVQIAHAMGCLVLGTSRTAEKLERARELGLDVAIVNESGTFAEEVREQTGGEGVTVIVDLLGARALAENLAAIARRGRIVVVGLLSGTKAEIDLNTLLAKRASIVGTTLRARPLEEKIAATRLFADQVVPWLAQGVVKPVLDSTFPLDEVRKAHERMASNAGFGKIVLRP